MAYTSPRTTILTMQSALQKRCLNTCGTMPSSWAERNFSMTAEDAKGDPLKKVLVPEVYNEMQKKMAEMAAEQAKTAEEETSEEEAAESAAEDNPAQEPAGEE